jgi:Flp pilus assembly protein TadG
MIRKFLRCENGASMIEFAVIAPFLVLVFMGLIELGRYAYFSILASHAARAAVAYGSENTTSAEDFAGMRRAAVADAGGLAVWTTAGRGAITSQTLCSVNAGALSACSVSGSSPPTNTVYYVSVTVTGQFNTLIHYPALPDQVWVSGSSTMRVGGQ